jgi:Uma2 family endonuclease
MAETGLLKPDARVELLDGQIIDMMPIGPFHAGTTNRLAKSFVNLAGNRWHTGIQTPIRLGAHAEPVPDLTLLKPAPDDYTSRHPGPEEVFLLIEVADSTLTYDRAEKLPAYGRAGIPEVWIVNLPERSVEIYREPHYLGYSSKMVVREGEQACLRAFPDVAIDVKALLKQATP